MIRSVDSSFQRERDKSSRLWHNLRMKSTSGSFGRRKFIGSVTAVAGLGMTPSLSLLGQPAQPGSARMVPGNNHKGACCIASANGLRATSRAMELLSQGYDTADCVVQGVRIMEDDPDDNTVGYGGLPNEDGIVELDASVMHGPTHKSGAVASMRNIKNPAMVALEVLRRTNHCLLVGEGALKFAVRMGFKEENLLTEASRRDWLAWRASMSGIDDWLNDEQRDAPSGKVWREPGLEPRRGASLNPRPVPYHTGTVHCSIVTGKGDISSCTSTSGLSWKIPGRVGDSPIIGAGNYCDNDIGAAGATGRGEAAIVTCGAFDIVQRMAKGLSPTEACLEVIDSVVKHCIKEKRHRDSKDPSRPDFDLKFYALRKDGAFGGATLFSGDTFAVHDGQTARIIPAAYRFEKK